MGAQDKATQPMPPPGSAPSTNPGLATAWRSLRVMGDIRSEFEGLYADYAASLDEARYQDWLKFFSERCKYFVQSRENFARGLPLATLAFESRGMLADRVFGVEETLIHQPYSQRHVLGPLRFLAYEAQDRPTLAQIECNYAVFRVKHNQLAEVFNVGRYIDHWQYEEAGWKLIEKQVIFDSNLVSNSIIYPL